MNHPKVLKRVQKMLAEKYGEQANTKPLAKLLVERWDDMPQTRWKQELVSKGWTMVEAKRLHFIIERSAL